MLHHLSCAQFTAGRKTRRDLPKYYGKSRLSRPVTVTGLTAPFVLHGWCIHGNYLFWSLIKDEIRASLNKAMQVPLKKSPSLRVVFFPAALSFVAHVVAHNQRPKEVVPNSDRRGKVQLFKN